jgi:hypothetical protein
MTYILLKAGRYMTMRERVVFCHKIFFSSLILRLNKIECLPLAIILMCSLLK